MQYASSFKQNHFSCGIHRKVIENYNKKPTIACIRIKIIGNAFRSNQFHSISLAKNMLHINLIFQLDETKEWPPHNARSYLPMILMAI